MPKQITIVIEPDGKSNVDLSGFHGKGCEKVMKDFQGGDTATTQRKKSEFFESDKQKQKVNQ